MALRWGSSVFRIYWYKLIDWRLVKSKSFTSHNGVNAVWKVDKWITAAGTTEQELKKFGGFCRLCRPQKTLILSLGGGGGSRQQAFKRVTLRPDPQVETNVAADAFWSGTGAVINMISFIDLSLTWLNYCCMYWGFSELVYWLIFFFSLRTSDWFLNVLLMLQRLCRWWFYH